MGNNKRLSISLSEEEYERFENRRDNLGMNRAQFIRYLLCGCREIRPYSIRYKEIVEFMSDIDRHIKCLVMKEGISEVDKIMIMTKLDDIKSGFTDIKLLDKMSKGG